MLGVGLVLVIIPLKTSNDSEPEEKETKVRCWAVLVQNRKKHYWRELIWLILLYLLSCLLRFVILMPLCMNGTSPTKALG